MRINFLFKQYKKDKLSNGVSTENRHECKFYDSLDQWWHTNGLVIKHVIASANDTNLLSRSEFKTYSTEDEMKVEDDQSLTPKTLQKQKKNFHTNIYNMLS